MFYRLQFLIFFLPAPAPAPSKQAWLPDLGVPGADFKGFFYQLRLPQIGFPVPLKILKEKYFFLPALAPAPSKHALLPDLGLPGADFKGFIYQLWLPQIGFPAPLKILNEKYFFTGSGSSFL